MYGKNIYDSITRDKELSIADFCEGYKAFLSKCKTERICIAESVRLAKARGFVEFSRTAKLKPGDKIYFVNKDKNIVLYVIGKRPVSEGMNILGAHVDSPRLDLKQSPIYESEGLALADTHYYGGIKKYQWTAFPLAMHGVVCKKDGSSEEIHIGESTSDPIVGITDLLVHLSADQLKKHGDKVIEGEDLDVTLGSIPLIEKSSGDDNSKKKDAVKKNILRLIKDKYNIDEEDLLSAEIEVVPAGCARDYGIDRSMIAGYGHDDRVCAYTSLMAILDEEAPEYTSCCTLVDKEEIGSMGATGAASVFFENTIAELLNSMGSSSFLDIRRCMENSWMLSSDVSAAVDPLYKDVFDLNNAPYFGKGIVYNKYTGSRGKSGSSDANPEYVAQIRRIMDDNNIHFQFSELGKVDKGGGGTIAYILAKYNMNVIDAGVAVLNMHAPMEIVSKADVYETYLAYKAFIRDPR